MLRYNVSPSRFSDLERESMKSKLTLPGTEVQEFSRYALTSAMRLLLKGLPDPTNILCGIVIPIV